MNQYDILNLGYQKHLSMLQERFIETTKRLSQIDFNTESFHSIESDIILLFDFVTQMEEADANIQKPYLSDIYFKQADRFLNLKTKE